MSVKFLLAMFLFGTTGLYAQSNHMMLIGGGGEPQGATTIFDKEITNVSNFLKSSGKWSVGVSFNGGHSTTEGIVRTISGTNPSFSQSQYEAMINDYTAKIQRGAIKSGDQLLVQISSHGAMNSKDEKSHRVSTAGGEATNLLTLSGGGTVSLDQLQSLIDAASAKGVKLAIVDLSCHSGNTLALNNPSTCIISATGPQHFGWSGETGFSNRLTAAFKPGTNLESAFLDALGKKTDPGFPMISSPVGQQIQDEMYKPITPFLYEWRPKADHDKLSPYLEKEVVENLCQEIPELQQILNFTEQAETIVSASKKQKFDALRSAITRYYEFQRKIKNDLKEMNIGVFKEEHKICLKSDAVYANGSKVAVDVCDSKTTEQIFTMDFAKLKETLTAQVSSAETPTQKAVAEGNIKVLEAFEAKKAELISKNVDLTKYKNYYTSFQNLEVTSRNFATEIAKEASKLYLSLYAERSKADTRPNPCKNFTL